MRLKSRGLGRKELVMDFREYTVVREGSEVVIKGTITEPVHWDFSIRMCEDDIAGITRVALQKNMLSFLVKALFKRNKDDHWTGGKEEHLKAAAQARDEARKKAADAEEKAAAKAARATKAADEASGTATESDTATTADAAGEVGDATGSSAPAARTGRLAARGRTAPTSANGTSTPSDTSSTASTAGARSVSFAKKGATPEPDPAPESAPENSADEPTASEPDPAATTPAAERGA